MKKILCALLVILVLAGQVGAASLTLSNEEHHNIGDLNIVTGTAAVNSGDTLSIGLGTILAVMLSPRNTAGNPISPSYGYRVTTSSTSSQTITINVSTNGLTWNFMVIGSGF